MRQTTQRRSGARPGLPLRCEAVAFPEAKFVATLLGGVLLFQQEHVRVADTPTPGDRAAWIDLLDEMAALDPQLVVPGHRLPGAPADASAIAATRAYLLAFEEELDRAADGAALTEAQVERHPGHGMQIAAKNGAVRGHDSVRQPEAANSPRTVDPFVLPGMGRGPDPSRGQAVAQTTRHRHGSAIKGKMLFH